MEAKIPSADEIAAAILRLQNAMPSTQDMRDALPDSDDFHLPGGNDFMRPEVLGGAAMVVAAFFLPPVWRVAAGVVGGTLMGYGLFVEHGPRYPSEQHGRDYYSTYGERKRQPDDDDLIDSMSMDSFPTSDPPATY